MTNQPMTSSEQGKILVFTLFVLPTLFIFGIIPIIFLIFGVVMMKRNENFLHIETAVKYARVYLYLLISFFWGYALFEYSRIVNRMSSYEFDMWRVEAHFIFGMIVIFYLIILHFLFLEPLRAHRDWVPFYGIFSSKKKQIADLSTEPDIIKGEKMKQFSVADELLKWAKLKEDGHITEQEFNEARAKLLKRE